MCKEDLKLTSENGLKSTLPLGSDLYCEQIYVYIFWSYDDFRLISNKVSKFLKILLLSVCYEEVGWKAMIIQSIVENKK